MNLQVWGRKGGTGIKEENLCWKEWRQGMGQGFRTDTRERPCPFVPALLSLYPGKIVLKVRVGLRYWEKGGWTIFGECS